MATLLHARDLAKTYAAHTLFTGVNLGIHEGERIGLIGPNGSGKSTLVKILAGLEAPDAGEVNRRRGLRLAYVGQADPFPETDTPLSAVSKRAEEDPGSSLDPQTRAAITLSKLGFADQELNNPVAKLSGGWCKRLSLACALVREPELLMLDEPTNHLDLDGVLWLEGFVKRAPMAVVVITHDRAFLESVAGRITELSRAYPGGTFEVKGNYSAFVRRKEEFLDAQARQQTALAGKVRRDTAWLSQGIKGRQTRNKSQVQDADQRRVELKSIRDRNAAPDQATTIDFHGTGRRTRKLLVAHHVTKSMGDKALFAQLDLILSPGDRLGLVGPNGSGKTTLLRLLTGDLAPDSGSVKPAQDLRIVNFTQHREALDPTDTLRQALCPVGDTVHYRGQAIHVAGWAKRFLFDPSKFNTSVGDLSGGEQARILIANLMLRPADVLILDEPTNDLDIPSLQVLEQSLSEFPGAIVLVTHDRFMLQRLATKLLALDGRGHAKLYPDFHQWEKNRPPESPSNAGSQTPPEAGASRSEPSRGRTSPTGRKKLTFKLQHELDHMEEHILAAEARVEHLQPRASDPAVVADHAEHARVCEQLGQAQARVHQLYERWAELETMEREASEEPASDKQ